MFYIYVNSYTSNRVVSETTFIGDTYCTFETYFNAYIL